MRRLAFSIVELLIAVMLTATVALGVFATMASIARTRDDVQVGESIQQSADTVLAEIPSFAHSFVTAPVLTSTATSACFTNGSQRIALRVRTVSGENRLEQARGAGTCASIADTAFQAVIRVPYTLALTASQEQVIAGSTSAFARVTVQTVIAPDSSFAPIYSSVLVPLSTMTNGNVGGGGSGSTTGGSTGGSTFTDTDINPNPFFLPVE